MKYGRIELKVMLGYVNCIVNEWFNKHRDELSDRTHEMYYKLVMNLNESLLRIEEIDRLMSCRTEKV